MPGDSPIRPSSHPYGFLQADDLIRLSSQRISSDVALLVHSPGEKSSSNIKSNGLKSLKTLASEPNPSVQTRERYSTRSNSSYFTNDPSLLYFRPVSNRRKVGKDDVCIAVKKSKVNVFDQEARARYHDKQKAFGRNIHQKSKMALDDFHKRESEAPSGMFMNQHGYYMPWSRVGGQFEQYIPEVCVDTGRISPSLFLDNSQIPEEFRKD